MSLLRPQLASPDAEKAHCFAQARKLPDAAVVSRLGSSEPKTHAGLRRKARRKAERKRIGIEELYSASYRQVRPQIEKAIAAKESELESLLDSFAGLSPKLKERANRRGEALQEEIDALKRDLGNLRITWDRIKEDLRQRKTALNQAVSTLNEEGRHRQKAEAVRTVVDRIVCHGQTA